MATHSSTLAWKIPRTEGPGGLQSMGSRLSDFFPFSLSCIGEGNGNPPQCSCLGNPRLGGAWWAVVYGVTQSRTRLKRLSSSSSRVCSNSCLLSRWCYPTGLILCCPLLFQPAVFPSIRVFSNVLALRIRWPKYWSFSFTISPTSEYSGLISFRIDWFDLHAVQVSLKSLLQHHNSKASILWWSVFFMVQFSHLYMATGKTITLTIWTFVGKVMSAF